MVLQAESSTVGITPIFSHRLMISLNQTWPEILPFWSTVFPRLYTINHHKSPVQVGFEKNMFDQTPRTKLYHLTCRGQPWRHPRLGGNPLGQCRPPLDHWRWNKGHAAIDQYVFPQGVEHPAIPHFPAILIWTEEDSMGFGPSIPIVSLDFLQGDLPAIKLHCAEHTELHDALELLWHFCGLQTFK